MLDAVMKCGDVSYAQLLFNRSSKNDLSMYGAMMKGKNYYFFSNLMKYFFSGYIKNNQANKAIDLFNEIKKPNEIVLNLLFNACAESGTVEALSLAKKIYKEMPTSFHSNSYVLTSMLDVLMKCGDISYAQLLFNKSPKKVLSMYGAMMKGRNIIFVNKCNDKFFSIGYIENNQANKAIDLFNEIKGPSEVNIIILFNACAHLGSAEALKLVKKVWKEIPKSFHSNSRLLTSLLDALIKCGDCSTAEILYSKMPKSVANYGNLMNGFNKENNPLKTLNLFNQMKKDGIEQNIIIYLSVIKALSQFGDYDTSQSIIKQIPNSFLSNNQIQTALIDMWVS
jgi:pentatricopeptide repeat protein